MEEGKYVTHDVHRLQEQCLKSAWLTVALHEGFKFPKTFNRLTSASNAVNGQVVSWTIGALLYRTRDFPLRWVHFYFKKRVYKNNFVYYKIDDRNITKTAQVATYRPYTIWSSVQGFPTYIRFRKRPQKIIHGLVPDQFSYQFLLPCLVLSWKNVKKLGKMNQVILSPNWRFRRILLWLAKSSMKTVQRG